MSESLNQAIVSEHCGRDLVLTPGISSAAIPLALERDQA